MPCPLIPLPFHQLEHGLAEKASLEHVAHVRTEALDAVQRVATAAQRALQTSEQQATKVGSVQVGGG